MTDDLDSLTGKKKNNLQPTTSRKRHIDFLKEEVGVQEIQYFGLKGQFSFKPNTFYKNIHTFIVLNIVFN